MKRHLTCVLVLCLVVATKGGEAPDMLHIAVGGFLGSSYDLLLTNGVLQYKAAGSMSQLQETKAEVITPTEPQWKSFRASLDEIGVWNWKTNYVNLGVLDGTQWSLAIKYTGKHIMIVGSNAYPDGKGPEPSSMFQKLMEAVKKLLSGKEFQ